MQVPAVLDLDVSPAGVDRLDRRRSFQPEHAGKRRKGIGEQVGHALEPGEVARAAVDRGPGQHLVEHRLGGGALDCLAFAGASDSPMAQAPSQARGERHTGRGGRALAAWSVAREMDEPPAMIATPTSSRTTSPLISQ